MGASISQVTYLMAGDFIRLVIIAIIIGIPVSWYFLKRWLQDYAYPTDLSWWLFGTAAFLSIIVAVLAVSIQSTRAASQNPAYALRHE